MGVGLYVEAEHTLRGVADLDRLFATYREWGVAGLKPGFVPVGTQEDTRWIRRLVETAARDRLWLCIHDAHVPDGMERTWPNLFISEGGGGQEGNHPASHDVRCRSTWPSCSKLQADPRILVRLPATRPLLREVFVSLGELDALRGVACWRGERNGWCRPESGATGRQASRSRTERTRCSMGRFRTRSSCRGAP